jgi:flagellar biosynthesis/type III secretory pathway M-ring protein FliF/YscJ
MDPVIWLWTWASLAVASLAILGLILKSVFNRLLSAGHQAERLANKLEALSKLEDKPKLASPESSILQDPAIALGRRKELLKARIKKQEQRQRRLIASLKRFDPNESRFRK